MVRCALGNRPTFLIRAIVVLGHLLPIYVPIVIAVGRWAGLLTRDSEPIVACRDNAGQLRVRGCTSGSPSDNLVRVLESDAPKCSYRQ